MLSSCLCCAKGCYSKKVKNWGDWALRLCARLSGTVSNLVLRSHGHCWLIFLFEKEIYLQYFEFIEFSQRFDIQDLDWIV